MVLLLSLVFAIMCFQHRRPKRVTCLKKHKHAILFVDKMAIKVSLDYDSKRDIFDRFHNVGSVRVPKPASEVLVLVVHGLCAKRKQLLCYFLSAKSMSSTNLTEVVLNCTARDVLIKGAPPGSIGTVSDNGWTDCSSFVK